MPVIWSEPDRTRLLLAMIDAYMEANNGRHPNWAAVKARMPGINSSEHAMRQQFHRIRREKGPECGTGPPGIVSPSTAGRKRKASGKRPKKLKDDDEEIQGVKVKKEEDLERTRIKMEAVDANGVILLDDDDDDLYDSPRVPTPAPKKAKVRSAIQPMVSSPRPPPPSSPKRSQGANDKYVILH